MHMGRGLFKDQADTAKRFDSCACPPIPGTCLHLLKLLLGQQSLLPCHVPLLDGIAQARHQVVLYSNALVLQETMGKLATGVVGL